MFSLQYKTNIVNSIAQGPVAATSTEAKKVFRLRKLILTVETKMEADKIRDLIINNLTLQGFRLKDGKILPPENLDKENIRSLHQMAVKHKIERGKKKLWRKEPHFLKRIRNYRPRRPGIQPGHPGPAGWLG